MKQRHTYHLVDPSPWPIITALCAFFFLNSIAMYMHSYNYSGRFALIALTMLIVVMFLWWRDIIREGTYQGHHTVAVQEGLRYGMILFIFSEVLFFVAFFWAFFHNSLGPNVELGSIWPPVGIETISPWDVPLLNTGLLLLSGFTITWAHHAIVAGDKKEAIIGLLSTVILAIVFTSLQIFEYKVAPFSISDGIFGSTFYLATGFHGFHVFIGTVFLSVCLYRLINNHFTRQHHFGFEAAAWYWHFVDVVWLFLFITVYWWGGV